MKIQNLLEKNGIKIFLFVLICFIWGSTWFTIKVGLQELPTLFSLSMRFLLAGIVLLILLKEMTIPSNLASILFATMPFFAAIFSKIFLKEDLNLIQGIGLFIGFAGVVFIFNIDLQHFGGVLSFESEKFVISMIAVIFSALFNASSLIMVKRFGGAIHPLAINFLPLTLSGLILFIISSIFENWDTIKFGVKGIGSVIYLGIFGSIVTFTVYYWLLKKVPAIIMSLTAFLTPVFAILIGVFIGKENITANILIGAVLILIGMLLVNSYFLVKKITNFKEKK